MSEMQTIRVPQVDGGVRVIAMSSADARRVRNDPAMIDHVPVLGAVDILRDGTREWAPVGPARIPPNIVAMLLRDDDEGERE